MVQRYNTRTPQKTEEEVEREVRRMCGVWGPCVSRRRLLVEGSTVQVPSLSIVAGGHPLRSLVEGSKAQQRLSDYKSTTR